MSTPNAPAVPERAGWRRTDGGQAMLVREWLVSNGLGGYAAGTVAGVPTRRFHGLLIAALPAPLGRTMMFNHIADSLRVPGGPSLEMSGRESFAPAGLELPEPFLEEFVVEHGRPLWRYQAGGVSVEKRLVMPYRQNTVHVAYRLCSAPAPVTLVLRPAFQLRRHEGTLVETLDGYPVARTARGLEISDLVQPDLPPLRLTVRGTRPGGEPAQHELIDGPQQWELLYRIEQSRGYDCHGPLWSPGSYEIPLSAGEEVTLVASAARWDEMEALTPQMALTLDTERRQRLVAQADPRLRTGVGAELVLAADQFIITPHTRLADEARQHAEGNDARTVIAGYHWFTDWGRDTMISLEGLTLVTGRHAEARAILGTFAHHIRDGLIPNLFPEGENKGLYHTADATLWFFHALDRYEQISGDRDTRRSLLPKLVGIIQQHLQGTRFGIGVDAADGLLHQGAEGYQLTWMDAKVENWVVTPRRGKAVEINALFYNALRLLEAWLREHEESAAHAAQDGAAGTGQTLGLRSTEAAAHAETLQAAFNRRFWYEAEGYLYDVVDQEGGGDDSSFRPNQIFAISLPHPVLNPAHWPSVLSAVGEKLLTPFGLRSLAPGHPDYKPTYDGDLRSRDAAYHQGTVWGWLLGPFVDAWLKVRPQDREGAARLVAAMSPTLGRACIGSISEIFDAEPPFTPRGCVAQAWSVAEALRSTLRTADPEG